MESIVGNQLFQKTGGLVDTTTALAGAKYVGIYFSAHVSTKKK